MTTEKIRGELEIDHNRGVVYFHAATNRVTERFGTATILRICRLPVPIPMDVALDITHMHGISYQVDDFMSPPVQVDVLVGMEYAMICHYCRDEVRTTDPEGTFCTCRKVNSDWMRANKPTMEERASRSSKVPGTPGVSRILPR